jgi:hypothetical protein
MINPTKEDIGRGVVFSDGERREDGVITSFNDRFVFVRYKHQHPSANGQATHRSQLEWLTPGSADICFEKLEKNRFGLGMDDPEEGCD